MKQNKETVSIRIVATDIKKVKDLYNAKQSTAAAQAVERFLKLREQAFVTLKGQFSKEEITALLDIFNAVIIEDSWTTRKNNKQYLLAEIEDAEKLEGLSSRFDFDYKKLYEKVKSLDHLQTFVLMDDLRRFWDDPCEFSGGKEISAPSMEKFWEYYGVKA